MMCFHANLSQRVFPHGYGLNSNCLLWVSRASRCAMLLETDWQSFDTNNHYWFRFRNHTFLFSNLSSCILHFDMVFGFWMANRKAAKIHRKTHDVEQTEKTISLITRENAFRQHVCELVSRRQHIWFGFWGPNWFCQTTNQAQLWVRDTCLLVGLPTLKIISITASLSSTVRQKLRREKVLRLCWRDPRWIFQHHLGWRVSSSWCWRALFGFRLATSLRAMVSLEKNGLLQQFPEIESRDSVHAKTSVQRILKFHSKVWVLAESTMMCRITHMAMWSVITRVMNVRNETNQTFVTSSGSFCDNSCQLVHRPKNAKSFNSCHM